MSLLSALLLVAAAFALLVLPGAAMCLAAGTRWRDALAAGPALTLAVVAAGATVTAATDIRWGPVSAGVTALLALAGSAALGMALRATGRRTWPCGEKNDDDDEPARRGPGPGVVDLVVVVLAAVPALQILLVTRGLSAIPQFWDALFHGGATRYIAETGRAGLTDLGPVGQPANPSFYYPDTYHALASLLLHLPGDGTPAALNGLPGALNALSAVTGTVFVLGVAVLARRLCGGSRATTVGAAVVGASCWVFPYQVLGWGPLLPFALGVAVIPGLLVLAERLVARRPGGGGLMAPALLLGVGVAGAWSVHPSVALAAAIPLVAQAVAGVVAAPGPRARLVLAGWFALAAAPVAVYAAWTMSVLPAGPGAGLQGFSWPRQMGVPRALAGVLDLGPTAAASVGITVFVLAGLVSFVAGSRRRRPLVAMVVALVVYGALYVLAAGVEGDWVRTVTGFWWDDRYRFAALLALPSAVLAGAGVRAILPRGSVRRPSARAAVAVVTVLGLLVLSGHAVLARDLREWAYDDGPAVNAHELAILDRLADRHRDGLVLNDPFDGTAWAYALHGVPMVFGTPLADDPVAQVGADRMLLYTSVNRYGFEPLVSHEMRRLDVRWVIVGTGVVGGPGRPGGFVGLHLNPNLRLVEENEGARLYEVLPVPADHPPLLPPPGIPPLTPPEQPPNTDSPLVDAVPPGPATNLDGATGP